MKRLYLLFFILGFFGSGLAYDKLSLVERFTNCSCGPCATANNAWYNGTTANLINSRSITHVIYNVDWPSPTDPMHILNAADNNARRGYYGVNSVPWIDVNGTTISVSQAALEGAVNSGNASYSPFKIEIIPVRFSNNVINVKVIITRDSSDNTTFNNTKLRVALTELTVDRTCLTCCNNGEILFHNVTRKMLPDGKGTLIQIPVAGDSVEYEFSFIPNAQFLQEVDITALSVVAFIQSDANKLVYQSATADVELSNNLNAAFQVTENLGALPFEVTFEDYSSATDSTSITSWSWDFDNDGNPDSQEPNPTYTFTTEGTYTVSLTVSDGINQYIRTLENYIYGLTNSADILVVNGIDYSNATYIPEMQAFYSSSACIGNHNVDVWDLFGDQGFNYRANSSFQTTHLFNRDIPTSVLNLYDKVIWIGNNFSGDLAFFIPAQVIDYVQNGGNFLLATRLAGSFFDTQLRTYCGVSAVTGDLQVTDLVALDSGLVTMPSTGVNNLVHLVSFDVNSEAVPIFDDLTANAFYAGFRLNKQDEGNFIFIAGRPYRFNAAASYANYDFIIDNWMVTTPTDVEEDDQIVPEKFALLQNYPNPFNPSTRITYNIAHRSNVSLKIYDLLGKEIVTLVNEQKEVGTYDVQFDASKLSSGVYIYSIQAGDFLESRKMILMK
ncbi:MAG: PKD domain-containing protein [Ignavibacteriales bacterium]|nr:PKD domain-containing protein [Ignavibacteriales bacterium]